MPVSSLGGLTKKSEGDSEERKTEAGGKPTFCRKGAYDGTDGVPGTFIHLLTLVPTTPMTLGEPFLPATIYPCSEDSSAALSSQSTLTTAVI